MIVLLFSLVAMAVPWAVPDVPNPRASHDGWVADTANILPDDVEARLEDRLEALHRELDAEVVIVTVDDVDAPTPKDFATALFNHWGIGDAKANNGLLVLMVMDRRRLEMETGYGLEGVLPDGWLGSVQAQEMVPRFKEGRFAEGIEAGMVVIDERMRRYPTEVREGTRQIIPVDGDRLDSYEKPFDPQEYLPVATGVGTLGGLGLLGFGGVLLWRRRERTCPDCKVFMPKLPEEVEGEHLDPEQELEEAIGSINWHVHQCPQCERVRTFAAPRVFSGHTHCPQCRRRTRTSTSETEVYATEQHSGRRRIDERCANCSYRHSYTRIIPRIPPPSSSSSSSGGGFTRLQHQPSPNAEILLGTTSPLRHSPRSPLRDAAIYTRIGVCPFEARFRLRQAPWRRAPQVRGPGAAPSDSRTAHASSLHSSRCQNTVLPCCTCIARVLPIIRWSDCRVWPV